MTNPRALDRDTRSSFSQAEQSRAFGEPVQKVEEGMRERIASEIRERFPMDDDWNSLEQAINEAAGAILALFSDAGKLEAREITRAQWIGGNPEMSVPYGEYCESELFRLRMAVGDHDTDKCIEIIAALRCDLSDSSAQLALDDEQIAALRAQLADATNERDGLQARLDFATDPSRRSAAQNTIIAMAGERDTIRAELDDAREENERLRAEMGYHEAADVIRLLTEERDDARQKLVEAERNERYAEGMKRAAEIAVDRRETR